MELNHGSFFWSQWISSGTFQALRKALWECLFGHDVVEILDISKPSQNKQSSATCHLTNMHHYVAPRQWSGHLHCYLPFRSFHGAPEVHKAQRFSAFSIHWFPASSVMVSPNSLETLLRFLRLIVLRFRICSVTMAVFKTTQSDNQLTWPNPTVSPCFVVIKQVENLVDAIPRLFVALSKKFRSWGDFHEIKWGNKGWVKKEALKQLLVIIWIIWNDWFQLGFSMNFQRGCDYFPTPRARGTNEPLALLWSHQGSLQSQWLTLTWWEQRHKKNCS